ncbi:MAG: hypothetical protein IAE79_27925 [Anaerolinea sp.]|nr:hypothetical protein [Anaerolinea sp.]
MGTKVTLTIPDYIYQQAKQIAQREERPLAEVFNEALVQIFPATHVSPDRAQMEQEQAVFRRLHSQLLAQYPGEYVAVYQGRVVDRDADRLALAARIDEKYPQTVVLIKQVTAEPDKVLYMRSPRLVQE